MNTELAQLPRPEDPFGLAEIGAEAFAAPGDAPRVQRVALPAAPEAAWARVAQGRAALAQGARKLRQSEQRLLAQGAAFAHRGAAGVDFAPREQPAAERGLWRSLGDLLSPEEAVAQEALAEQGPDRLNWERFVAQLRRALAHPVQVQTQVGAALIGYTAMDWTGSAHTLWQPAAPPFLMGLHQATAGLVLDKITSRLRLLTVVSAGAAQLAAALAGGPIAMVWFVPTAWRFARDVLEELR